MIAAGIAAWTSHRSAELSKNSNRAQLLDRRLDCFKLVQEGLSEVLAHGNASDETQIKMRRAMQASWFIFPDAVTQHLEQTYKECVDLWLHNEMIKDPNEPSRKTHVQQKHDVLIALNDKLKELAKFFRPYMDVE